MPESNQCYSCKNFYGYKTCKAFPDGIPEEIITGEVAHTKPLKGQLNNIVFELKPQGYIVKPQGL